MNGHDSRAVTLTIIRTFGVVVPSKPLELNPYTVRMFGNPKAPVALEFVDIREVDALHAELAPHVKALIEYAGGTDAERIVAARETLRGVFDAPEPALVTPA